MEIKSEWIEPFFKRSEITFIADEQTNEILWTNNYDIKPEMQCMPVKRE